MSARATTAVATPTAPTVAQRIEAQIAAAAAPLTAAAIRKLCRIRNTTLTTAFTDLVAAAELAIRAAEAEMEIPAKARPFIEVAAGHR